MVEEQLWLPRLAVLVVRWFVSVIAMPLAKQRATLRLSSVAESPPPTLTYERAYHPSSIGRWEAAVWNWFDAKDALSWPIFPCLRVVLPRSKSLQAAFPDKFENSPQLRRGSEGKLLCILEVGVTTQWTGVTGVAMHGPHPP